MLAAYLFFCCIVALVPALLVTLWFDSEYTKYPEGVKGTPKKIAAIERAKKEGRFAIAHLIKCGPSDNEPPYDMRVKYEYSYNGKIYHLRFDYRPAYPTDYPPKEMEVYFRKSPKKAKTYSKFGHMETERKYVFLFLWVVFTVVLFVFLIRKVSEAGLL